MPPVFIMKEIKIFIRLNLYALILDLVFFVLIFLFFEIHYFLIRFIISAVMIVIVSSSLKLHSSYKQKYRIYRRLLLGNQKRFRSHTFQQYMNAPCTRQIVLQVLDDINKKNEFSALKKKYQTSIWSPKVSRTRIVLYKEGEIESVFDSDFSGSRKESR